MKIPIPFTYEQDERVIHDDMGVRRWRKVFEIDLCGKQPSIGWTMQIQYSDNQWSDLHASGFHVSLGRRFEWSEHHVYYDGPHCCWSFGFIRVYRGGNWHCKKCMGEL